MPEESLEQGLDENFLATSIQGLDGCWWSRATILDSWCTVNREFFIRLPNRCIVQISEETYSKVTIMEKTPLSEADPRSLDDLFTADPLSLTDSDVDRIVSELRTKRALWEQEDKAAKVQGRARRPTAYRDTPKKGQLSLKGLGIKKDGGEA